MKAKYWAIAVVAVVLAALLWFFLRPAPGTPVEAMPVGRGPVLDSVTATTTGTILSDDQAALSSRVAGQVATILHMGDAVGAGEPMAVLDEEPYRAALRQAEGAYETARADFTRLESGRRMREEGTDSERDRAKALFDRAKADFDQSKELRAQGIVSDQAFRAAEADFRVAEATWKAAVARLDDSAVIGEELRAARARVEQMGGALEDARLRLSWCRILAPFAGVVGERFVREGELVNPGQLVASVYDPANLYVETAVDEVDLPRIAVGERSRLLLDSFPGEEFAGRVRRISPVVSTKKREGRTADIEVTIEDPSGRVKPGMSVDCEVITAEKDAVLWVPTNAVLSQGGKKSVWLIQDGRARRRSIETGVANWEKTEITEGLREGEVVVTGNEIKRLVEGRRLRAIPPEEGTLRRPVR